MLVININLKELYVLILCNKRIIKILKIELLIKLMIN